MQLRILAILVVLALAAGACWLAFAMLQGFFDALRSLSKSTVSRLRNFNVRRVERKRQLLLERQKQEDEIARQIQESTKQAEQEQIEEFRLWHPAQIVGVPDLDFLKRTVNQLDIFIAAANSYRPQFAPVYNNRFRATEFSFPFEFFFPRTNPQDDGPEPAPWQTTLDSLAIKNGTTLSVIYNGLASASEFPAKEPSIVYDRPPLPQRPNKKVPALSLKIIPSKDGSEIDIHSDILARVYAPEIAQFEGLWSAAEAWHNEIKRKIEQANEAHDMMELYIANENLKFRELKQTVALEYGACKKRFEQLAVGELKPIRDTYKEYLLDTQQGVEEHFNLALREHCRFRFLRRFRGGCFMIATSS